MKINFRCLLFCLSLHFIHANISSAKDELKLDFPILLSSEVNLKKNQLVIKIINQSTEELLVDWEKIKKIQLNYWFDVGGSHVDSGYTTEESVFLNAQKLQNLLVEDSGRFIRLRANKETIWELSLDPLLAAVSPFINNFPNDKVVAVQVYGSAIAPGRFVDGKIVPYEKLENLLSAGNVMVISKSDVVYMLSRKPKE